MSNQEPTVYIDLSGGVHMPPRNAEYPKKYLLSCKIHADCLVAQRVAGNHIRHVFVLPTPNNTEEE